MDADVTKITARMRVALIEPTKRSILVLIANDKTAFNVNYNLDLAKDIEALKNPTSTSAANLQKGQFLYVLLRDENYIKDSFDKNRQHGNKLTIKGWWYLLITHPALSFWVLILTIATLICSIVLRNGNDAPTNEIGTPKKKVPQSVINKTVPDTSHLHAHIAVSKQKDTLHH